MDSSLFTKDDNNKGGREFDVFAETWWDESGPAKVLHAMNRTRLEYITQAISNAFPDASYKQSPKKLRILDVGCGGGLLSIPLAKIGFDVTAIDQGATNIGAAEKYAKKLELQDLHFKVTSLENFASGSTKQDLYDIIICCEVIEHVTNPSAFLQNIVTLIKGGGILIFSTINKTIRSFINAIILAEYVLKMVPRGLHRWSQFLSPADLIKLMSAPQISLLDLSGITYQPMKKKWVIDSSQIHTNYIMSLKCALKAF